MCCVSRTDATYLCGVTCFLYVFFLRFFNTARLFVPYDWVEILEISIPEVTRYQYPLFKVRHRDRCFLGEHGAALIEAALVPLSSQLGGLLLGCHSCEGGAMSGIPGVLHVIVNFPMERYHTTKINAWLQQTSGYVAASVYISMQTRVGRNVLEDRWAPKYFKESLMVAAV